MRYRLSIREIMKVRTIAMSYDHLSVHLFVTTKINKSLHGPQSAVSSVCQPIAYLL